MGGAVADLVRAALVGMAERKTEEPVMGRHLPFGFALHDFTRRRAALVRTGMTLERPAAALAGGAGVSICTAPAASLADKVAFLSRPDAYPHRADEVIVRETHMSWVFLAGPRAYKLKKPVRFPYLYFSTLARREAACRAELKLNRRLAGDVYVDVIPFMAVRHRLSLAGSGDRGRLAGRDAPAGRALHARSRHRCEMRRRTHARPTGLAEKLRTLGSARVR